MTTALLERAGLDGFVSRVISIDEVRQWKPAPAVYRHAADVIGVEPTRLAHVAVPACDLHGAHDAGLITGWAPKAATPPADQPPDTPTRAWPDAVDGSQGYGRS